MVSPSMNSPDLTQAGRRNAEGTWPEGKTARHRSIPESHWVDHRAPPLLT